MENLVAQQNIENRIFNIRGVQVMFDSHLGELYGVETKLINKAVKRNLERFPEQFMFQLTESEWNLFNEEIEKQGFQNLRFQNGTSSFKHGGRRYLPYVFTEQGVAMLSAVLRSETAVKVSIQIMNAFVGMRKILYHIGASLKDMGTKWFAFSKMNEETNTILNLINSKL